MIFPEEMIDYASKRNVRTSTRRILASLFDFEIILIVAFPLMILLPLLNGQAAYLALSASLTVLIPLNSVIATYKLRGTLGKLILGARIVDIAGASRPSLGQSARRELVAIIAYTVGAAYTFVLVRNQDTSTFAIFLSHPSYSPLFHVPLLIFIGLSLLEWLSCIFSGSRTSIQDAMADTEVVVYGKAKISTATAIVLSSAVLVFEYLHVHEAFREAILQRILHR